MKPKQFDTAGAALADSVRGLSNAVLRSQGDTSAALRQTVAHYVAVRAGGSGASTAPPTALGSSPGDRPGCVVETRVDVKLPGPLKPYIDKVARHAYRVVDADIEALRQADYSEDAILELTFAAALGSALGRIECGLAAIADAADPDFAGDGSCD